MKQKTLVLLIILLALASGLVMVFTYEPKLFVVLSIDYEDLANNDGSENLPEILDLMDRLDAKGTFFISGTAVEKNPSGIREIHARGHSIGLHSYYHNFPIFNMEDAGAMALVYNSTKENIWDRSFKTQEEFLLDIKANQMAIKEVAGVTPVMFRAPGLAPTWDTSGGYFKTLIEAGIEIDSSIQQNWSNLEPFYERESIVEIPPLLSEKRLDDPIRFQNYARRCFHEDIPLVIHLHPQNIDRDKIKTIEEYLDLLDEEYNLVYIKLEDVPNHF